MSIAHTVLDQTAWLASTDSLEQGPSPGPKNPDFDAFLGVW